MALTATATRDTLDCVVEKLSMNNPKVIGLPPNRDNITYIVRPSITLKEFADLLASELLTKRTLTPKTVVFCVTVQQVVNIFKIIKKSLNEYITEPPGVASLLPFRLIDMFTAGTKSEMRQRILSVFSKKDCRLRVILATSAFGLGVDCPDITRIINWGPPPTLEDLLQQSGRAGRDGSQSDAVLYYVDPGQNTTAAMKNYGTNSTVCRRDMLYKDFLFSECAKSKCKSKLCKCCDICAASCSCSHCEL